MIQTVYNKTVRPFLPRKIGVLNGVAVRKPRVLDTTDVLEDYEAEIISALRTHVKGDDDVVVVGGGLGVSSVVAARHGSTVTTYEAGKHRYKRVLETLELNNITNRVEAHHALVGPDVHVNGSTSDRAIAPEDLPECDVLEVDAEGAEVGILQGLEIRPRVIIVEAHAHRGAPAEDVYSQLDRLNYDVANQEAECREKGIIIITAVHQSAPP